MTERARFFAIIPIHGENKVVEGKSLKQVDEGVSEVLRRVEVSYPRRDFRSEVTVIKGKKVNLPQT